MAAARAAAGDEHYPLLARLCGQAAPSLAATLTEPASPAPTEIARGDPGMPEWYAEPVRVFDDLVWVGQTRYSAWAVTTSEGIVVIDPLFDYSVEAAIEGGLREVGLDPADIRYVIVSHGHLDHVGGARRLQEAYGARVVMHPADWDLVERTDADWPKPVRDIEAMDGYRLTIGGKTLVTYHTPGHTAGTLSTVFPVTDRGEEHVAVLWGGTAFNFMGGDDDAARFEEYAASAERLREIAREAGADVLLSNHPQYDGSTTKLPALAARGPADPHPYVVGLESIERFLTVAARCAEAGLIGAQ
ncbi:MAG TPA: MBL fold metallo-hydrolase [Longimicrobiales bacterium]|nr:MBL fold metallo-hydrolase [Longimicrobiales bacterium]